jgi:hypothetical protein
MPCRRVTAAVAGLQGPEQGVQLHIRGIQGAPIPLSTAGRPWLPASGRGSHALLLLRGVALTHACDAAVRPGRPAGGGGAGL